MKNTNLDSGNKPNTYTQIYIQIVFAVKGRQNFIGAQNREELQKYLTGIIRNRSQKLLAIYCMPDHVHILLGLKPNIAISDLVKEIKSLSSPFVTGKKWKSDKFYWQEGFGAFSYSKSQIDQVAKYILNQENHHKRQSFKEEYIEFLQKFDVDYDEKYLFELYD